MATVPMDTTHQHLDNAVSIIRYSVSDGQHIHIHRIHSTVPAAPAGVPEPAIPASGLFAAETTPYEVIVNFFKYLAPLYPADTTLAVLDARAVSNGGTPQPVQSVPAYSVLGSGGAAAPSPAAQTTLTFRDAQGAPCSVRLFRPETSFWFPGAKVLMAPAFDGVATHNLEAYLLGEGGSGSGPNAEEPTTSIVSHNGFPFKTALAIVSTLNNRLRREYKLR